MHPEKLWIQSGDARENPTTGTTDRDRQHGPRGSKGTQDTNIKGVTRCSRKCGGSEGTFHSTDTRNSRETF